MDRRVHVHQLNMTYNIKPISNKIPNNISVTACCVCNVVLTSYFNKACYRDKNDFRIPENDTVNILKPFINVNAPCECKNQIQYKKGYLTLDYTIWYIFGLVNSCKIIVILNLPGGLSSNISNYVLVQIYLYMEQFSVTVTQPIIRNENNTFPKKTLKNSKTNLDIYKLQVCKITVQYQESYLLHNKQTKGSQVLGPWNFL